jgi:hypothetical protein
VNHDLHAIATPAHVAVGNEADVFGCVGFQVFQICLPLRSLLSNVSDDVWDFLRDALPGSSPPWEMIWEQTQCWLNASCFESMANDLRSVQRMAP